MTACPLRFPRRYRYLAGELWPDDEYAREL
jgi:hypothetical protein